MKIQLGFLIGVLLMVMQVVSAQPGRYTEEEVKLQELFIAANGQKLQGNYEKAIELFGQFLEKERNNAAGNYEIARLYDLEEQNADALKHAKRAVENEPSNLWYHILLADLYLKNNMDDKSAEVYASLVNQYPNEEDFYYKWAYCLVRANQPQKAIEVYDQLQEKIGINEEIVRRKNTLYLGLNDFKNAEKVLKELVDAFPKIADYRLMLAKFYEQSNDEAAAKKVYLDILKFDRENPEAKIALAEFDQKNGATDSYFERLKPVFENPGVHIDVKITELLPLVNEVAEKNDTTLAKDVLELAYLLETVHPNEAKSYAIIGDLLNYSNQPTQALIYYQKTLEYDANVYLVWEQMLYLLAEQEQYDALIEKSNDALDLFPNQSALFYLNGLGLGGKGEHEKAIGSLQQSLIMSRSNPAQQFRTQQLLGEQYAVLGQYDRADKSFEAALKIKGDEPLALSRYAQILADRPQPQSEKALQFIDQAVDISKGKNPEVLQYQKIIYQKLGKSLD